MGEQLITSQQAEALPTDIAIQAQRRSYRWAVAAAAVAAVAFVACLVVLLVVL